MKTTNHILLGMALMGAMASSCNSTTTTTSTSDSTSMRPGDSAVTTTTTTTTVHHKYAGSFVPKANVRYLDLKTHKQVTVRIDTERGQVVNSETNEPMDLFVAPNSTDTFFGQTGTVANNHITVDDAGLYKVDLSAMTTVDATPAPAATPAPVATDNTTPAPVEGKYKEKDNGNKKKLKTADEKIKERNGIIKEKDR